MAKHLVASFTTGAPVRRIAEPSFCSGQGKWEQSHLAQNQVTWILLQALMIPLLTAFGAVGCRQSPAYPSDILEKLPSASLLLCCTLGLHGLLLGIAATPSLLLLFGHLRLCA